jgi:hypothetical protein
MGSTPLSEHGKAGGLQVLDQLLFLAGVDPNLVMRVFQHRITPRAQPARRCIILRLDQRDIAKSGGDYIWSFQCPKNPLP